MSIFKQALANAKISILLLLFCFVLSMFLNIFLGICLYRVPKKESIYIPPHIPNSGLTIKAGAISNSEVYAFAYYIWQAIQTWAVNGAEDYKKNLDQYAPYITPNFKNVLEQEGKALYAQGFLYGHQQMVFGAEGRTYSANSVKYIGHNTWLVHLDMRTINRIAAGDNNQAFVSSHVVRDAETNFVFKVVKYDYAPNQNHWHLAIAGYAVPPKVSKIYK